MAFDFETLVREATTSPAARQEAARQGKALPSAANDSPASPDALLPSAPPEPTLTADILLSEQGISSRIWDQPVPRKVQAALDRLLEHLRDTASAPNIMAKGSPLQVCTKIITTLQAALPVHMHKDLDVVLDHAITYICDYCEASGTASLSLNFEFKRG